MEFYREDRSVALSLWNTESMIEYFRDMRDMGYEACTSKHGFWPLFVQVVVFPEGKSACLHFCSEQTKEELDDIVKLFESLDDQYHLWGNTASVVADEFERELSIQIDVSVPVESIHTHVRVDAPMGHSDNTDIRFVLSGFNISDREAIQSVLNYDESHIGPCESVTMSKLLVMRGYVENAFSNSRILHTNDDYDDKGYLDGFVRVSNYISYGDVWPDRGIEGFLVLNMRCLGLNDEDASIRWDFLCDMWDADVSGKVEYRCDLSCCDYCDSYIVKSGFVKGIIDTPSWWEEYFEPDDFD